MSWTKHWPATVSTVIGALLVIGIVQSSVMRGGFVAAHPFNLIWIAASAALVTATFYLNRARVYLGDAAPFLGFGGIACLLGFAVQGLVNPALTRALGPETLGLGGYLLLGLGAGVCQTGGKWAAVAFLDRLRRPVATHDILAIGLAVGLGFACTEIVSIGQGMIVHEQALAPPALFSLWERTSAGGFHVYSGALVGIGVALRRTGWIGTIVVLHTGLDWLSAAFGAGLVPLALIFVETIFLLIALVTWLLYWRAKTRLTNLVRQV